MWNSRAIALYCIVAGILGGIAGVITRLIVGMDAASKWPGFVGTATTLGLIGVGYALWSVSRPIPDDK